jgi:hypothetical protein
VRPDPLSEAAARRHELTRSRAVQALRELDRAGTPVTFAGVAQAALLTEQRRRYRSSKGCAALAVHYNSDRNVAISRQQWP